MLVLGAMPRLALRTISNVFIYNMTSSILSVLRLSYTAFYSLSDTERIGVRGSMDSVSSGSGTDSAGRAGDSTYNARGG